MLNRVLIIAILAALIAAPPAAAVANTIGNIR